MDPEKMVIPPEVGTIYQEMITKHKYKYVFFRLTSKPIDCPTERKTGTFYDLLNDLAKCKSEPLYILYQFDFINLSDRKHINKIVFIFWCPESADEESRQLYKLCKDRVKSEFSDIHIEFQTSTLDQCDHQAWKDVVASQS